MKKYINIKKFVQNNVRNVRLVAVAVAGLGIAISCSTSSAQEGCTPSITVSASADPSSCFVAGVTVTCVGDTTSDTVIAQNSLIPANNYSMSFVTNSGDACDTTTWSNTVDLVAGVNKITATNSDNGLTSSAVDVTQNNGYSWTYAEFATPRCALDMHINVSCLTPNAPTATIDYWAYETPGSGIDSDCLGNVITRSDYPGATVSTDANGKTTDLDDGLGAPCPTHTFIPSTTTSCSKSNTKVWHIYNHLDLSAPEVTESSDTVTKAYTTTTTTISDSECGPAATFN